MAQTPENDELSEGYRRALDELVNATSFSFEDFPLEAMMKAYQYQGFEAHRIKRVLAERHAKLAAGAVVTIGETDVPIAGEDKLPILVDYLVDLYNHKGNNISEIRNGLPAKARANFTQLITTLELQNKVTIPGKPKNGDTLTLARIAAVYPIEAVTKATHADFDRQMIDLSDVGVDQKTALGKALAHSMAANVLTDELKKKELPFVTFLAAIRLNNVLNRESKQQTKDKLWSFHKAALDSTAASEQAKQTLWATVGQPSATIVALAKTKLAEMGIRARLMKEIAEYCATV